jgi:glyoxylase-like metal-dependent hydrolase (beta-lactamase superfamily II)
MEKWFLGFLCVSMAAGGAAAQENSIFTSKVGQYEVSLLVETQGPGRSNVLIGAGKALLDRYIPGNFTSETNTFLVRGGGKNILIDTGFGGAVFDHLKKLGLDPGDIDAVLLTHMHGDHIGGLAREGKALFPRAQVYVAGAEKDYWTVSHINQGAVTALAPYGDRVKTFTPGELGAKGAELVPGITPIAAYGHTPGHTVFLIRGGDEQFLVWGDLMHVELVQFPQPDISVTYDTDPEAAARTRKAILDYAAKNKIPSGGMHLVYPGTGIVREEGSGYQFIHSK